MALLDEPWFANPGPWTYTGDAGFVDRSAIFLSNYARLSGVAGQEGSISQRFHVFPSQVGGYLFVVRVGTDTATVGPLPFQVRVFLDGVEDHDTVGDGANLAGYTTDSHPDGSQIYNGPVFWPGWTSRPQSVHMAAGIHTLRIEARARSDATDPARHIRYHYIDFLYTGPGGDVIPGAVIEYGLRATYVPGGGAFRWTVPPGRQTRILYHAE